MEATGHLVVAIDSSEEALSAVEWALSIAAGLGGRVTVVHAVGLLEEGGYRNRPDVAAIVERSRARVAGAADVVVDIVEEDGPAVDVIVRVADHEQATMVVIGSRGVGQATRLLGSVSEGVLAGVHVPVLIVPRPRV